MDLPDYDNAVRLAEEKERQQRKEGKVRWINTIVRHQLIGISR